MTAPLAPCPVCGRRLPPTAYGRLPHHVNAAPGRPCGLRCPGSGALAPAGDLFPDAPQAPAIPATGQQGTLFPEG